MHPDGASRRIRRLSTASSVRPGKRRRIDTQPSSEDDAVLESYSVPVASAPGEVTNDREEDDDGMEDVQEEAQDEQHDAEEESKSDDEEEEFLVEKIIDSRYVQTSRTKFRLEYRVVWAGGARTWEPEENVNDTEALDKYEAGED